MLNFTVVFVVFEMIDILLVKAFPFYLFINLYLEVINLIIKKILYAIHKTDRNSILPFKIKEKNLKEFFIDV